MIKTLNSFKILMVVVLIIMSHVPSLARADDPVGAFGATFRIFSDEMRGFPEEFTLYDAQNRESKLEFGEGAPWRLINFWATWCAPCIVEMPSLKALQDRMAGREDIEILLVSADLPDDAAALEKLMKRQKMPDITYHYVKDMYLWQRFEMQALPSTYLVSPRGLITYGFGGEADWASPKAAAFFDHVIK